MTQDQIIDHLKTLGYTQYFGFENILEKNDHSVSFDFGQVTFNHDNGCEETEDLDYFENAEDVWSWIQGWLDDIADYQQEEED